MCRKSHGRMRVCIIARKAIPSDSEIKVNMSRWLPEGRPCTCRGKKCRGAILPCKDERGTLSPDEEAIIRCSRRMLVRNLRRKRKERRDLVMEAVDRSLRRVDGSISRRLGKHIDAMRVAARNRDEQLFFAILYHITEKILEEEFLCEGLMWVFTMVWWSFYHLWYWFILSVVVFLIGVVEESHTLKEHLHSKN